MQIKPSKHYFSMNSTDKYLPISKCTYSCFTKTKTLMHTTTHVTLNNIPIYTLCWNVIPKYSFKVKIGKNPNVNKIDTSIRTISSRGKWLVSPKLHTHLDLHSSSILTCDKTVASKRSLSSSWFVHTQTDPPLVYARPRSIGYGLRGSFIAPPRAT